MTSAPADTVKDAALALVTQSAAALSDATEARMRGNGFVDLPLLLDQLTESKTEARRQGATDAEIHTAVEQGL